VDGAFVFAAGLENRRAESQVAGAADFFVKESVLGKILNFVIGPDCELADIAGALVGAEHLLQKIKILVGRFFDNLTLLELQANVLDLTAHVNRRETVADISLDAVLERSGKNLAVGEILRAGAIDPFPSFHA